MTTAIRRRSCYYCSTEHRRLALAVLLIAASGLVESASAAWATCPSGVATTTPRTAFTRLLMASADSSSSQQQQQQQRGDNSNTKSSSRRRTNQQTQQDMLRFMDQPVVKPATFSAADAALDTATLDLVHCIVRAADGRKAENIRALAVQHLTTLTSALVVVSGNSRPQNQAISAAVSQAVAEAGFFASNVAVEGTAESGWMLLDYGSVMVHVMTPKSRLFYNVEGQWKDSAVSLDLSAILVPNTVPNSSSDAAAVIVEPVQEDDPFWS